METLIAVLKKMYVKLPVTKENKVKLKGIFYTIFGVFLKNTQSYRDWQAYQQWLEYRTWAKNAEGSRKQGVLEFDWKEVEKFRYTGKIAIHLHLFYIDLMHEFVTYFSHMPYEFDLYISIIDEKAKEEVMRLASAIPKVNKIVVKKVENRGRDVAPLLAVFGKDILKYDYFCHVHSKKSLFTGNEQVDWRKHLLEHLFGSEQLIRAIFYGFEHGDKVGMVYPETVSTMPYWAHRWLQNEQSRNELYAKIGITGSMENEYIDFPMGTMFWGRIQALRQFFEAGLNVEDFPEEQGQTDGTIAHAFERCTVPICRVNGYHTLIYDDTTKTFMYNIGRKNFEQYYVKNFESLKEESASYDLISFDLFDTLVSRNVARPDDAFDLLEYRLHRQGFSELAYKRLRKEAEAVCRQKRANVDCDLDDIYKEFVRLSGLTVEECERIKEAEVEQEYHLVFPKKEMVELYHYITDILKKRVFFISDMYLRRKDIVRILEKCGLEQYEQLLISSEINLRKDNGTFWKEYSRKYSGLSWMHIGDNEKSDIQLAGDYGIRAYHIMSIQDLYACSDLGEQYPLNRIADPVTSVSVGLTLRRLLDNPFALNHDFFSVRIRRAKDFGYAIIGPVILGYMNDLCRSLIRMRTKRVFFFAREGWLLKDLFHIMKETLPVLSDVEEEYLYVSRRALSIASLKSREDLEELLAIFYKGSFLNLLHTRFGIEAEGASSDQIELPKDAAKVSGMMESYKDEILQRAEEERKSYLHYYQTVKGTKGGRTAVSDIGYSGTIQYYLSKLTEETFDGYYFATDYKKKPMEMEGNTMHAYYVEEDDSQEYSKSFIHRYHLLLESILIAPQGQFVCMKEDGTAIYTEEKNPYFTESVIKCQEGIRQYFRDFYGTCHETALECEIDRDYPEALVKASIESDLIEENLQRAFLVEDFYCSNEEISVFEHYMKKNQRTV